MPTGDTAPILIAGGGIGGLVLALMLHDAGIPCTVLEAAQHVRPLGVGINLLPHAVRELQALRLLPALDAAGIRTRTLTYANQRGQEIWAEPRGRHAGHDAPQFSIHRGRLHALLWAATRARLGGDAVHAGHRVTDVAQDAGGVTATIALTDGGTTTRRGAALIGADGIHSWLRAHLHPDQPGLRWNGISMWRGATDWDAFDGGDAMVVAGDTIAKLVLYPIGPGSTPARRLTNWVIYARVADPQQPPPDRQSWSRPGHFAEFRHFADRLSLPFIDIAGLIGATAEIYENPMCDRDPLPWWTAGRLTLLGDAAHPMYPVGSNGASQAIVDARCLVSALQAAPVADALAAYAAERLPATAAVVQSNRIGGPERVIDLAAGRAPHGFRHIHDIATPDELAGIVRGYARTAGFAVAAGGTP